MDGSKDERKNQLLEKKLLNRDIGKNVMTLIIGSNLFSVGVKWYLISRTPSKDESHFLIPSPLLFA